MNQVSFGIEPIGAVYFGDGRPTDAGETDFGRGRFPPTPRTMQGLIRTALLRSVDGLDLKSRKNSNRIRELVGPPEHLPVDWKIFGPWIAEWEEKEDGLHNVSPWLPIPRYLIKTKSGNLGSQVILRDVGVKSDLSIDIDKPQFCGSKNWGKNLDGYISAESLLSLLAGNVPVYNPEKIETTDLPDFIFKEIYTGLRITPGTEMAEPGMLYSFNYYRLKPGFGFIGGFTGLTDSSIDCDVLTRETTSLGGRNRLARLLKIKSWHSAFKAIINGEHLPENPIDCQRFWVFSVTPVQMKCPWKPFSDNADGSAFFKFGDASAKILTAVVGKRESIGGFSLALSASSSSSQYLKAGSAWLIEVTGGSSHDRQSLLKKIHNNCVLGSDLNENGFGFGHAIVANPLK